jgi:LPXTG-motif cell wall-anchored protein
VPVTTATPTGSSSSRLLVLLGSVMLIVGLQLVLLSRRRGAESETSF